LGASAEEVMVLQTEVVDAEEQYIEGIRFLTGEIEGWPVVVARTGVGKVNAAMVTTLLIEHFRPGVVIVMGVAGGTDPSLLPGDVIIAERTAHHDLGSLSPEGMRRWGVRNPIDESRNPVFFPGDSLLMQLAERAGQVVVFEPVGTGDEERIPRVVTGVVVSGDVFVRSSVLRARLHDELGADAVEMEGAATAQICWQRRVPCLVVRCLSDLADESAARDYQSLYQVAARNSARLVLGMIRQLASASAAAED
jgi:adenosylhomocysteine nucleosidase